jgi:ribonuclease BN (tRNA processing enzyme)
MTGSLTFLGTATTLVEYGGLTVLTDPNFLHKGDYAYLGKGLVSKRLTEPALGIADLPRLDAIVLSHLHGDHFDRVAARGCRRTCRSSRRRPAPASSPVGVRAGRRARDLAVATSCGRRRATS